MNTLVAQQVKKLASHIYYIGVVTLQDEAVALKGLKFQRLRELEDLLD